MSKLHNKLQLQDRKVLAWKYSIRWSELTPSWPLKMVSPPRFSSSSSSKDSKMSMLGWWMVHTMVLPVFTMLRTVRITMAAALASKPAHACVQLYSHIVSLEKCITCVEMYLASSRTCRSAWKCSIAASHASCFRVVPLQSEVCVPEQHLLYLKRHLSPCCSTVSVLSSNMSHSRGACKSTLTSHISKASQGLLGAKHSRCTG